MGNERRTFQSFKTYADTEPIITQLTDEEAGRIFKACYGCYFRGETMEFRPGDDRMFKGAWGTFEMKLLAEQKKDSETSEKRSSAGREGGLANAKGDKQKIANAKGDKQKIASVPTYTDTVTGTNSSTTTISSTVTDTEQADAVSADRLTASAAAEDAEPSDGDLFSFKQIKAMARRNKVNLTDEGLQVFYEEMQNSGWILYQKPVEKKGIVKAVRGWAKNNPQYHLESTAVPADSQEKKPPKKVFKSFKPWLKYHGYDSNYENGFGEFDEEIAIDEEMIQIVWRVDNLSESANDINMRLMDAGYTIDEVKASIMLLFKKWTQEKEGK